MKNSDRGPEPPRHLQVKPVDPREAGALYRADELAVPASFVEGEGDELPVDRGDGVTYERIPVPNRRAKRAREKLLRAGLGVLDKNGVQRLRQAGRARGRQR